MLPLRYNCLKGTRTIADRQRTAKLGGEREKMVEAMTDKQFDKIFQMFEMILDGCKDLDDAKRKVKELREDKRD